MLSGASDDKPDKQGRVTIGPNLRTYAGLEREVAVIGAGTRMEIWDLKAWETYLDDREQEFSDIDRKSTRLNSSHVASSYAVFCLKNNRVASTMIYDLII